MSDNWDDWNADTQRVFEPLPAGQYVARLENAEMYFNDKGARTKLTLVVIEGQHERQKIWEDYPHNDKFKWLARMAWEGFGYTQPPQGELMEHKFSAIAQGLVNCIGKAVRVTTDLRTKTYNGEERKYVIVRRIEALPTQAAQQPQGNPYGGKPEGGAPW
jgi:hypothetical protein